MNHIEEEMAWLDFRAEAMKMAKKRKENFLKGFLKSINYNYPIGYSFSTYNHTLKLFVQWPSQLIGKGGTNIETLKNELNKEFTEYGNVNWEIKIIEVDGGFVNKF